MKKLFIILAFLLIVSPVYGAGTLYEFYLEKGQNLPPISERAEIYSNIADDAYFGLYGQNIALLDYLQSEKPAEKTSFDFFDVFKRFGFPVSSNSLGGNVPASAVNWTLSTPLSSSATTIDVSDFEDLRNNDIATSSFPTKVYFVIEAENTSNTEIVMCSAVNCDETNTQCTGCTRGLSFSGTSETAVTANQKAHPSGASVIMTNVGQFFNNFVDIDSAQTVAGVKTFSSNPILPTADPTTNYQATHKLYVDNVTNQGAATGTETTQGIWEGATQAEMGAGTIVGGSGNLALQSKYASNTPASEIVIPVTEADGDLNAGFIGQDQDYTWSGDSTFSGENTFSATTTVSANLIYQGFGGTGVDGALNITTGTTTLDADSENILVKNYTSINIATGTVLEMSDKATDGTILILKSQGDCTIAGLIDLKGDGADSSTEGFGITDDTVHTGTVGGNASGGTQGDGGAGGVVYSNQWNYATADSDRLYRKMYNVAVGSGGGVGGIGDGNKAGGAGGAGGGGLIIECGGYLNFVSGSEIRINGNDGLDGVDGGSGQNGGGGGGGGGAAGMAIILYNGLTANSGIINAIGGAGGTGGDSGDSSDAGSAGAGGGGGAGGYLGAGAVGGNGDAAENCVAGTAGTGARGAGGGGGAGCNNNANHDGCAGGASGTTDSNHYLVTENLWF